VALERDRHVVLAGQRAAELVQADRELLDQAGAESAAVDRLRLQGAIDRFGGADAIADQELADPRTVRRR
jgi:hypothetical protein